MLLEQIGGVHVAGIDASARPARRGSYLDPLTGVAVTRLTDCATMSNPDSANPPAYRAPNEGLTNGYSRYSNVSRDRARCVAYGTSQLGIVLERASGAFRVLKQKDGQKILAENRELRWNMSGAAGTAAQVRYWGLDGVTFRVQDLAAGPASERVLFTLPKVHKHTGDWNTDIAERYVPVVMIWEPERKDAAGKTTAREIDALACLDLVENRLLPGMAFYDLGKVDLNGCSISPDGKWLCGQLDFYRIEDLRAGVVAPQRGAIRGGHGGWAWLKGRSVWVWQEEATDYIQVYDPEAAAVWQVLKHAEYDWAGAHVATILNPAFDGVAIISTYDKTGGMGAQCFAIEVDKPLNTAKHPAYGGDTKAWDKGWTPAASWGRMVRLCGLQGTSSSYYNQMFASLDWDGLLLQWGSNWHGTSTIELYEAAIDGWYTLLRQGMAQPPAPAPRPTVESPGVVKPGAKFPMRWDAAAIGGTAVDLLLYRSVGGLLTLIDQLAGGTKNDGQQEVKMLPVAPGIYVLAVKSYPGAKAPRSKYYSEPFEVRP